MKLSILNGSPRGEKSNSKRMSEWILSFASQYQNLTISEHMLYKSARHPAFIQEIGDADCYLMVFPLYVDSMPSIVKSLMELMSEKAEYFYGKPIYFIIHSGFPEVIQSELLRKYTAYFTTKVMKMTYKGTVIMAGSEAMQVAPDGFFSKKIPLFHKLLDLIIRGEEFNPELTMKLSRSYRLTPWQRLLFRLNPLKDFYWNFRLKKSGARHLAKAKPYL